MNLQKIIQINSQTEINKLFLKSCKDDNFEIIKYLLTSEELIIKPQLKINKKAEYNEKKDEFYPLIAVVKHNSKKVCQYLIEETNYFSHITKDGKVEILKKCAETNNVEMFDYLFKQFEQTTNIKEYEKPFLMTKVLESVINNKSDKIFDYLMLLSGDYKHQINTKNDMSLRKAAEQSHCMLEHMLKHIVYKDLSTQLYLSAFNETKNNPESALILFQYGIKNNMFEIYLSDEVGIKHIRDKVKEHVFKTYHNTLIKYMYEGQSKLSELDKLKNLVNEVNVRDFFYVEDNNYKNKNKKKESVVLKYVIEKKLLAVEKREEILIDIVEHNYKNLMQMIIKYPQYTEDMDLNNVFLAAMNATNLGKDQYLYVIEILNIDFNRKIKVSAENYNLFNFMEISRLFGENHDEEMKKVFINYHFLPDDNLKEIYKVNPEMLKMLNMKILNMTLSKQENNQPQTMKKKKI